MKRIINPYKRPGQIENSNLLQKKNKMYIKDDLIEHFDYEGVSDEVWKYLYAWYSSDWVIVRYTRKDRGNADQVYIDLYPEKKSLTEFLLQVNDRQNQEYLEKE